MFRASLFPCESIIGQEPCLVKGFDGSLVIMTWLLCGSVWGCLLTLVHLLNLLGKELLGVCCPRFLHQFFEHLCGDSVQCDGHRSLLKFVVLVALR